MKTLLFAGLFSVSCLVANAQHIDAGIHGGYGTTWFLNNNVSDQGDELDYKASFGPLIGIHGGYFFESNFGVVVEIDMAMNQQEYTGKSGAFANPQYTFTVKDKMNYIEVPVLIRKCAKSGFYFEVGPKFSFLSGAKETYSTSPSIALLSYNDRNVADGYKKTIVSVAFGLGGQFKLSENIYADLGLRFSYGFTDATKEFSQAELTASADKLSIGTSSAHYDQKGVYTYKGTHLATGHVLLGVTYRIPMSKAPAKGK